jgi:hypothetical protein
MSPVSEGTPVSEGAPASGTMAGHGFYADHSQPQHRAAELGLDLLEEAAARIPLHDDGGR